MKVHNATHGISKKKTWAEKLFFSIFSPERVWSQPFGNQHPNWTGLCVCVHNNTFHMTIYIWMTVYKHQRTIYKSLDVYDFFLPPPPFSRPCLICKCSILHQVCVSKECVSVSVFSVYRLSGLGIESKHDMNWLFCLWECACLTWREVWKTSMESNTKPYEARWD